MNIKAKETLYNGYRFRSRLEAKWAVFFDACGVEYEYEPEGFDLGNGVGYLPDFLLHGVRGDWMTPGEPELRDLWIEVKGNATAADLEKINIFAGEMYASGQRYRERPILILGNFPAGDRWSEVYRNLLFLRGSQRERTNMFDCWTLNFGNRPAILAINMDGQLELCCDKDRLEDRVNAVLTMAVYNKARRARFEHGQTPTANDVRREILAEVPKWCVRPLSRRLGLTREEKTFLRLMMLRSSFIPIPEDIRRLVFQDDVGVELYRILRESADRPHPLTAGMLRDTAEPEVFEALQEIEKIMIPEEKVEQAYRECVSLVRRKELERRDQEITWQLSLADETVADDELAALIREQEKIQKKLKAWNRR